MQQDWCPYKTRLRNQKCACTEGHVRTQTGPDTDTEEGCRQAQERHFSRNQLCQHSVDLQPPGWEKSMLKPPSLGILLWRLEQTSVWMSQEGWRGSRRDESEGRRQPQFVSWSTKALSGSQTLLSLLAPSSQFWKSGQVEERAMNSVRGARLEFLP